MITIPFYTTAKAGREDDFAEQARDLMDTTRAEDDGCIAYAIYRQTDNAWQFVLFEQWRGPDALNAHIARLQRAFGAPDDHEPYPATHHRRRLPKAFLDLFEKTDAVRYDSLE